MLPITRSCFDDFSAGKRKLFDVTAEELRDQSQTLLLDSVTEFVNQSKRPWFQITESLSLITVSQVARLASDPSRDDFEIISFSASPLNGRRLKIVGFEAALAYEPEFKYRLFIFSENSPNSVDNQHEKIDRFSVRSTLKHFTHLMKAMMSPSSRRQMVKSLLVMVKQRLRSGRSQTSAA